MKYDFWTHGVNVVVESPEKVKHIRRAGWGTDVTQPADEKAKKSTFNWFHFPIPTPTIIRNDTVEHYDVWVKFRSNKNAFVNRVDVWDGDRNVIRKTPPEHLTGDWVHYVNLPNDRVLHGLVVCVLVEFTTGTPVGEITFISAGAKFNE